MSSPTFQIQATTQNESPQVNMSGNQYTFTNPSDLVLDENQTGTLNANYKITQIPTYSAVQITPSEDLISNDILATPKRIKWDGIGSAISLFYKHIGKKKTLKKGDRLFKMIVKKIGLDPLDILKDIGRNRLESSRKKRQFNDRF